MLSCPRPENGKSGRLNCGKLEFIMRLPRLMRWHVANSCSSRVVMCSDIHRLEGVLYSRVPHVVI